MSSPHHTHTSDEEHTDPRTPTTLPYPDDAPMEDSFTNERSSEEETEEEPSETDPASPRPVSPIEESRRNPSFTIFRQPPGAPWTTRGPRPRPRRTPWMSVRAPQTISFTASLDDPYRPPTSRPIPDYSWISAALTRWRQRYGNPFATISETASQFMTPMCPVTREPPHLTIPLLIMRLDDQEDELDHMKDNLEALPAPEEIQNMQADMEFYWRTLRDLRTEFEKLRPGMIKMSGTSLDLEERVIDVEDEIRKLHVIMRAKDETIRDLVMKGH